MSAEDSSSEDDDLPLISSTKQSNGKKGTRSNDDDDDSSSSDGEPLLKSNYLNSTKNKKKPIQKKKVPVPLPKPKPKHHISSNNTINHNNINNDNIEERRSKSNSLRSRKRKHKFRDSDDSDESSNESSEESDGEPIIQPSVTSSPKKKRKISTTSTTSSDGVPILKKRSRSISRSISPTKRKKKRRRLDEDYTPDNNGNNKKRIINENTNDSSKPGYINRDVFPASNYSKKTSIIPLQPDINALKWWELPQKREKHIKWTTLDHNGIVFAPPYEPHGVKMLYDGKELDLTPDQEEIAHFFAQMMNTDYAKKEVFQKNFMRDWKKVLRDPNQERTFRFVTDFEKCDFKPIYDWVEARKERVKEERKQKAYKEKQKSEKEEFDKKYGWALVDGVLEKVGNYKVEPPGLFRGRGTHPKMGQLKKRIMPEDIILNIGEKQAIPPCPIPGHEWGGVIHDHTVTYIAKWIENINDAHKFVYLHASSRFKGEADRDKYEKARKLKKHVDKIRQDYNKKMNSDSLSNRQLAIAVWMIDKLSIRVGNEKDLDEEADTVGVCSLRVEHCKLLGYVKDEDSYMIELDFLGKDSMRYLQKIKLPEKIYKNIENFCKNKKKDQDIFHKITSDTVNKYLKEHMNGLTAKVFRTHNASVTLQNELKKNDHKNIKNLSSKSFMGDKLFYYNYCNKQVAILCNHQKSVSKSHNKQLEKIKEDMAKFKEQLRLLKIELKLATGEKKKKPKEIKKIRSIEKIEELIKKKKQQIRKKELSKEMKEENKQVALGTSKINYMDPRITVAWCKKFEVPIEKVFNKSLQDKFPWAMSEKMDYVF